MQGWLWLFVWSPIFIIAYISSKTHYWFWRLRFSCCTKQFKSPDHWWQLGHLAIFCCGTKYLRNESLIRRTMTLVNDITCLYFWFEFCFKQTNRLPRLLYRLSFINLKCIFVLCLLRYILGSPTRYRKRSQNIFIRGPIDFGLSYRRLTSRKR